MSELEKNLGYSFRDGALLRRALTHPSMGKKDNQRLEFLGDAVLQYLMSDKLYREYPENREGGLTHLRALLVCEAALSQVAARRMIPASKPLSFISASHWRPVPVIPRSMLSRKPQSRH